MVSYTNSKLDKQEIRWNNGSDENKDNEERKGYTEVSENNKTVVAVSSTDVLSFTNAVRNDVVLAFVHLMAVWLQLWNFHWILPLCSPANFCSSAVFSPLTTSMRGEKKRKKCVPGLK